MSERAVYHVTGTRGNWRVTREGAQRASAVTQTKADAVERARELAKAQDLGQVKIHGMDGQIQREYTYGQDPEKYPG